MTSTILVTGVNGDIGRSVVKLALGEGKRVLASVRNEAHCDTFDAHANLHFLIMHTDQPEQVKQAFKKADEMLDGEPLNAVIHCAAIQSPACVEFMDPAHMEQTLRVNTIGSLSVMQNAFPRLRASSGNLVVASSIWGLVSGPAVTPYAPSKWALEALMQSARCETKGMGFSISSANIGAVKSRMLNSHVESVENMMTEASAEMQSLYSNCFNTHIKMTQRFNSLAATPDQVAKKLLQIADKRSPKARYAIGTDARVLRFLNWLLPQRAMDAVLSG